MINVEKKQYFSMSLFGLFGFQPPQKKKQTPSRGNEKKNNQTAVKPNISKNHQKSLVQLKPSFLFQNMFMVLPGLHSG
jgi:hypothetical protein